MLEAVGHAVSRLIRIRYGAMMLPRGLKRGAWMELDDRDIQALLKAVGAERTVKPIERASAGGGGAGRASPPNRRSGGRTGSGAREGAGIFARAAGAGPSAQGGGREKAQAQPDPLKTSVGYIGVDSLSRQRQEQRKAGRSGPPGGSATPTGRGGRR